jgi:hypothetical protein
LPTRIPPTTLHGYENSTRNKSLFASFSSEKEESFSFFKIAGQEAKSRRPRCEKPRERSSANHQHVGRRFAENIALIAQAFIRNHLIDLRVLAETNQSSHRRPGVWQQAY